MKRFGRLLVIGVSVWAGFTEAMAQSLIAEFPSPEFSTSLEAIAATFERCRDSQCVGRTVLLSAQSYEAGGDQYEMYDATYRDGTFRFERPVLGGDQVARAVGISSERVIVNDEERTVTVLSASPPELARLLDYIYRVVFEIRPLPGGEGYNFVAELE